METHPIFESFHTMVSLIYLQHVVPVIVFFHLERTVC